MENKKLLNILTKDMQELEELIAEIKLNGKFNAFEFEFLHNRAKGLLSLVNLLQNQEEEVSKTEQSEIVPKDREPIVPIKPSVSQKEPVEGNDTKDEDAVIEPEKVEEVKPEEIDAVTEAVESIEEPIEEKIEEVKQEKEEIGEEFEEVQTEKKEATTIGDSFASEKSLNDIISEAKQSVQNTISSRPISSLQSAVGINDRFLFIRELFEGDGDQYADAVKNLDQMNSIQEAVNYLRDNYKWKKNDTSLKFIDLVKRRFANG